MSSRAHNSSRLPENEHAEVLEAIIPQDDDMDPAFFEELSRRVRSIQDGTAVLHDHEDVRRDFMTILKR